jgi:acyl-CoA thioester hydrolase
MVLENVTDIRVRYADTDKMGVVYNGNYLTFFEVGRTELMRQAGLPYIEFEKAGYMLPLIEAHVNYKQSAYYDDILNVYAKIDLSELKATIRFEYRISVNDKVVATGWTIHTFVKMPDLKPVRPPKIFTDLVKSLKNK